MSGIEDRILRCWAKRGGDFSTVRKNVRHNRERDSYIGSAGSYGHRGITPELERENAEITLAMPISTKPRPQWYTAAGFANICHGSTCLPPIFGI